MSRRHLTGILLPLAFLLAATTLQAQSRVPTIFNVYGGLLTGTGPLPQGEGYVTAVTAGGNVSGNGFLLYIYGVFDSSVFASGLGSVTLTNENTGKTLTYVPNPATGTCTTLCFTSYNQGQIVVSVPGNGSALGNFYPDAGVQYLLDVVVNESDEGNSNIANFTVNPNMTVVDSGDLPAGAANQGTYSTYLVDGGTAPLTFGTPTGNVPQGLTLSAVDDTVSGIPTTPCYCNFAFTSTDFWGNTSNLQAEIEIFTTPTLNSGPSPTGVAAGTPSVTITILGTNIAQYVQGVSTSLPGATVSFTAPGYPYPVTVNITPSSVSSSQIVFTVTGAPLQTPGVASITIVQPQTINSEGALYSVQLPFYINAPTITSPATSASVPRTSPFTITGTNFVPGAGSAGSQVILDSSPITTTVVSATQLTSTTIPSLGQHAVYVLNPGGSTSGTVTFQAINNLQITTASLPGATYQVAYTPPALAASGGVPPYTWGSTILPAGLTLNAQTGFITGTPTAVGNNIVSFTVTDAIGTGAGSRLALNVTAPPLVITTTSLPGATYQVAYTPPALAATGGVPPYTWSSTALPAGLTLNAQTGFITGTPTVVGNNNVTFTVKDSLGTTTTGSPLALNVTAPPLVITTTSLPGATYQVAYTPPALAATGGVPPYTWSSTALPAGLTLNAQTGAITGSPTAVGNFNVTFTVKDSLGTTTTGNPLALNVTALPLVITTTLLPPPAFQVPYSAGLAATGGVPPYSWAAGGMPPGLNINAQTGAITGTPTAAGTYTGSFTVTDSRGITARAQFPLDVAAPTSPISFTTAPKLPDATQGVPYSASIGATGGTGSYTFTISGSAPAGLTFSASGSLSGTPTTSGSYNFTVTVKDGSGNNATQSFTLNVKAGALQITTTGPFASVVAGSGIGIQFAAAGGVPPYTWSASGTPTGTSFSTAGALTGNATQPGTFNFTVTVKDSAGTTASQSYTQVVTPAPLTITGSLGNGVVGAAYNGSVGATGGVSPYSFTATGVPDGLTFSNGSLTGTPTTAGTFTVAVTVTDSATPSAHATQSFTVTITTAALTVTASLGNGAVNTPYNATLTAAGGTPPYTFTVTGLPPGVTASGTAISGTPTTSGTFSVSVTVTDSSKKSASQTFSVTIAPAPLTISTPSLPAGSAGGSYSATLSATGGVPPYTFSASGLPSGLSLSSSGVLSGSVSAPTTANFTVTVKDSAGATASQGYSVTFGLPATPPVTLSGVPPTGTPGAQSTLQIGLGSAYPVAVTVNLTLTFAADSGPDDPTVQFATGGRTAQLTIPAGSTVTLNGVGVQTGTVAGTATITAQLLAGGQDITPKPAPTITIRINAAAPSISSVTATNSNGTITVTVTGFCTTRSITQAIFQFTPAAGVNVQTTSFTVSVSSLFTTWYSSSASIPFGSQFLFTQPFTVQGTGSITSVTVTLVNATGSSTPVTATIQ